MAEAAIERPDENPADVAPAAPAAPASTARPGDDFENILEEYQAATSRPATQPDQPTGAAPQASGDEIDQLLAELSQPTAHEPLFQQGTDAHQQAQAQDQVQSRLDVLQSENQQLKQFVTHQRDVRDFGRLAAEVQSKLPDHLPSDYAETQLLAAAINNPTLQAAFDYRSVDPRLAAQELRQVEMQLNHAATLPAQREMLQQHAQRLNIAINSKSILRRAMIEIRDRAESHRPLDPYATADHDAVAAAVRGRSGTAPAEPPPNFGAMSDADLRRYTREHFGF
jgi:hypothetical protein